jgi:hypothetical protein
LTTESKDGASAEEAEDDEDPEGNNLYLIVHPNFVADDQ